MDIKKLFDFAFKTACESYEKDNPGKKEDNSKMEETTHFINSIAECCEANGDICYGVEVSTETDGSFSIKLKVRGVWEDE